MEIDWKAVLIPAAITGLIAGVADALANMHIGWKAATIAGVATFLITLGQEVKNSLKPGTSAKRGTKLFLGQ